jgi:hypothetical protein
MQKECGITQPKRKLLTEAAIEKRSFEPIAAAQNDLFIGYVGFGISKRKKPPVSESVAL